jgi:hypothetical protein
LCPLLSPDQKNFGNVRAEASPFKTKNKREDKEELIFLNAKIFFFAFVRQRVAEILNSCL